MAGENGESTITILRGNTISIPRVAIRVHPPNGQVIEVDLRAEAPITVGTDAACDLKVNDPSVSARHCEVALTLQGIRVRDLGSKNGTIIGDIRTFDAILPTGVAVTIGSSRLTAGLVGTPELRRISRSLRFGQVIGRHPLMGVVFAALEEQIAQEAERDILDGILLLGAAGTGKELLARSFHDKSPRAGGPFIEIDCTIDPPHDIEARILGGAGNVGIVEQAQGGTLYIKAVDELTLRAQARLARAMKQNDGHRSGGAARPFDVRVIATTEKALRSLVEEGEFWGELFFRLVVVRVPPLSARREDIPVLVEHFLALQSPPRTLEDLPLGTLSVLREHPWPGNVEELRNVVRQLFYASTIHAQSVASVLAAEDAKASLPAYLVDLPWDAARVAVINDLEKRYLMAKLKQHDGNLSKIAEKMGITRQHVHNLKKKHGL